MDEKDSRFDLRDSEVQQSSVIEDSPVPVFRGPRASNTLESLRPRREVQSYQYEKIENAPEAGEPFFRPTNVVNLAAVPVRKTDNPANVPDVDKYNVLPVNWPASGNKPPKPVILPSVYDRVTKLEEQVDALLDRIALHNVRSSHKI